MNQAIDIPLAGSEVGIRPRDLVRESRGSVSETSIGAPVVFGVHRILIEGLIRTSLFLLALKRLRHPLKAYRALLNLERLRRRFMGEYPLRKFVRVAGRYYWSAYGAGFPSRAFFEYHVSEIDRMRTGYGKTGHFMTLLLGITKRCPLRCEHCFEGPRMGGPETLSSGQLQVILRKFQDRGVAQVQLGGGEPLSRFDDLVALVESADNRSDLWLSTSGYMLTRERAHRLRKAGLTAVAVSLDHFDAKQHNAFRGSPKSFDQALQAVRNARSANLVVIFRICVTRNFVSDANLMAYARFAAGAGASFVEILDPRATGNFAGKDVELTVREHRILDAFYEKLNFDPAYRTMPIVAYAGYHQRRAGCFGAGDRFAYVDTNGDIHACPFCSGSAGNALADDLEDTLATLRAGGCGGFATYREST